MTEGIIVVKVVLLTLLTIDTTNSIVAKIGDTYLPIYPPHW